MPDGINVLHGCDNPPCCNPAHLRLGTQAENIADCIRRNRKAIGERTNTAKLTPAQIREIRASGALQSELARQFNVTQPLISMIKGGKLWTHVQQENEL